MMADWTWGALDWWPAVAAGAALMFVLLVYGYRRVPTRLAVRILAATLKVAGVAVLALCLLEPLLSGTKARQGANLFLVVADSSRSMTLKDRGESQSRGEQLHALLADRSSWSTRLGQDFDVRRYAFDSQLRSTPDYANLPLDGIVSALGLALDRLARRYQGRPLAGILLFTDGNLTDGERLERLLAARSDAKSTGALPPIYPVLVGGDDAADDVRLTRVAATQTNFEDVPVTLAAQVNVSGYGGGSLLAQLLDEHGKQLDEQRVKIIDTDEPTAVRFQFRPTSAGVSFYQIRVSAAGDETQFADPRRSREATIDNNSRWIAVDRGRGPYRVLYVAGRPNWEFKFLRRAVEVDDQVELVGLLRIAKREPKFDFRSRAGEGTNPLFRGFDPKDKDAVEQYDEPVIIRLGTEDEGELRGGFPKTAEELYRYHAIVLDDVEAEFFTPDQMQLVKDFVRQRGGGLLMLGGQESFKNGRFDRTPIGELLPVYLDAVDPVAADSRFQLALTREGYLAPWVRLRKEEATERQRLSAMPRFHTLNQVRGVKPGATILATVTADATRPLPALVEQRFGQGRVGALLIGDLWRWTLRRPPNDDDDLAKSWRQTVRWLVGDVPQRVGVDVKQDESAGDDEGPVKLAVDVRDEKYMPLENASVTVKVTAPDGKQLDLTAEPSNERAGMYQAEYVARQSGTYRAQVHATAEDGSEVGQAEAGWVSEPAADEFRELRPNRELLKRLADETGGEVVAANDLDRFVTTLPTRRVAISEPYVAPAWHQAWIFLLAIACLTAEWGIRRWHGLP
jgi:uncharacterized membrane protein